ncbi:ABC transporter ATP-binding protein [Deferribacterales bacterium Es71-Z0220]|jgi:putative ABC transport system ATP-binding protein|uniref:ABC transporter ATP-binding protein n=1 Tax=Deferrivibrio essentukiensis TaxID=2880922 RepID=UPI001F60F718|nr:ABC transporter ATP-binding protein [Deferrivibrio essentukiensis]MCB4203957.1 ABC transporter ATP-binding protein [Deferrivibrio essentukiensis]
MIKIKGLCKVFDGKPILSNINIDISKGDILIIKGPSGSGKSTLLSLISGLARPTSGAVYYNDMNISKLPEIELGRYRNEKIGFIFQKFNLLENLTVYENILPPLVVRKEKIDRKKIEDVLKKLELLEFINTKVSKLSGGEQQRVALARALVNKPDILLADEPTANLDYNLKMNAIKIFLQENKEGKTIIIATHDDIFLSIPNAKVAKLDNGILSVLK